MSDERFYNETVYNDSYYFEREQELIRESNLELDYEESIRGPEIAKNELLFSQSQNSPSQTPVIDYSLDVF
jgi:hypothetical protein